MRAINTRRGPDGWRREGSHSRVLDSTLLRESKFCLAAGGGRAHIVGCWQAPYYVNPNFASAAGGGRVHIVGCSPAHYYVNASLPRSHAEGGFT